MSRKILLGRQVELQKRQRRILRNRRVGGQVEPVKPITLAFKKKRLLSYGHILRMTVVQSTNTILNFIKPKATKLEWFQERVKEVN